MKKTILITGGLGYIGSHAVVAFEQAGYKCIIVDNLSNSNIDTLSNIEKIISNKPDFFEVDLRDREKLEDIFKKYNFDGVIHFAGLKAVGESCEKPLKYYDNNVVGSIRLFECMQKYNVKNIIFSSSATVYDFDNEIPYVETQNVGKTTNTYAQTKYLIEQILRDLSNFIGFNAISLRYFNPIGAHPSGFIGESPNGIPNNLLPYIMKVAKGELPYLKIFGNDYNTIDGTGVRDYIDVVDLIDGHLKAYEILLETGLEKRQVSDGLFDIYNLGAGKGVSVLEILKIAEKVVGKKIHFEINPRRNGDLGEFYCNPGKAKNELGWETKTSLEESLENSWRFYNK
ncbi:MAG: UDP-glucose 4-epimerase GalE [Candidatus Gracilibacteria bacterium]